MAQAKMTKTECSSQIACDGNLLLNNAKICNQCLKAQKRRKAAVAYYNKVNEGQDAKSQEA